MQYFYGADDENASKSSGKVRTELAQSVKEEKSGQPEYLQPTVEQKNNSSSPAEETEGSALLGKKSTDHETENSQRDGDLNEDTIKEAIKKRASYFRANSEYVHLTYYYIFTSKFTIIASIICLICQLTSNYWHVLH